MFFILAIIIVLLFFAVLIYLSLSLNECEVQLNEVLKKLNQRAQIAIKPNTSDTED